MNVSFRWCALAASALSATVGLACASDGSSSDAGVDCGYADAAGVWAAAM